MDVRLTMPIRINTPALCLSLDDFSHYFRISSLNWVAASLPQEVLKNIKTTNAIKIQ